MSEGNTKCMFCTLFVGVLDLITGHLDYCNGGHNAPLLKRVGTDVAYHFAKVKVNLPVGVSENYPYKTCNTDLNHGDVVLLYTDGVTEAENTEKRLFGDDALRTAFLRSDVKPNAAARDYVDGVYAALVGHTSGAEQNDDITMLAIAYS